MKPHREHNVLTEAFCTGLLPLPSASPCDPVWGAWSCVVRACAAVVPVCLLVVRDLTWTSALSHMSDKLHTVGASVRRSGFEQCDWFEL